MMSWTVPYARSGKKKGQRNLSSYFSFEPISEVTSSNKAFWVVSDQASPTFELVPYLVFTSFLTYFLPPSIVCFSYLCY